MDVSADSVAIKLQCFYIGKISLNKQLPSAVAIAMLKSLGGLQNPSTIPACHVVSHTLELYSVYI